MNMNDRKLKPWEQALKDALQRRTEHESEAFLTDTHDDYLSAEELEAQKAKLMKRLQAIEAERKNQAATAPVTEWQAAGKRWLKATREGIEQLAAAFDPPPALAFGYRRSPVGKEKEPTGEARLSQPATPKPSLPWIPVELRTEDEAKGLYRLVLKHLGEAPPAAPAVTLFIGNAEGLLEEVDYDTPPMLHLVFRTKISLEPVTCRLGVTESDEGLIEIRLNRNSD